MKKVVDPVLYIEKVNGIVVKKDNKYGLMDITGKELVPIAVDAIYAFVDIEDEKSKYYMLYNGKELNVIERLIQAGLIEEEQEDNNEDEIINNSISNNLTNGLNNSIYSNTYSNTIYTNSITNY